MPSQPERLHLAFTAVLRVPDALTSLSTFSSNTGADRGKVFLQDVGGQVQAVFTSAMEQLEQNRQQLEEDRRSLAAERDAFEKEKQAITTSVMLKDSDIVELNVSGTVIAARRSTLCQVPGSMLAAMFSGRWEQSLARDSQGRVFLEFNLLCFRALLDALVYDGLHPGSNSWRRLELPTEHRRGLDAMLDSLGLFFEVPLKLRLAFKTSPSDVHIEDDDKIVRTSQEEAKYASNVVSRQILPSIRCIVEVEVCRLPGELEVAGKKDGFFYLGVVPRMDLPNVEDADDDVWYDEHNCFGWAPFITFVEGQQTAHEKAIIKQGDRLTLDVDLETKALSLVVKRGRQSWEHVVMLPHDAASRNWHLDISVDAGTGPDASDTESENKRETVIRLLSCRGCL